MALVSNRSDLGRRVYTACRTGLDFLTVVTCFYFFSLRRILCSQLQVFPLIAVSGERGHYETDIRSWGNQQQAPNSSPDFLVYGTCWLGMYFAKRKIFTQCTHIMAHLTDRVYGRFFSLVNRGSGPKGEEG